MQQTTSLVLVGGFGFVGRNILAALDSEPALAGFSPAVVDDLSNAAPGHDKLSLRSHVGGYETDEARSFLSDLPKEPGGRIFVFLAGETRVAESKDRPMDFIEANISAPSRFVWDVIEPGDRFILISTAGALFDGTFEVRTESPFCPKNFYGATKAAEEMVLEKLVELRGGQFSVVRMTNVYGVFSDKKKSAIHAFTRAAIEGREVTINGDGGQTRDFVFSGDVGRGIAELARRMRDGDSFDRINMLGAGSSTSLMDVVHAVEAAAGKPLARTHVEAKELLATEPRDVIANPDDVAVLLGEGITQLADGIAQTHAYYARSA